MLINVTKLHAELVKAGIPIDGCASDGRIDFKPEATEEQKGVAQAILANHDPVWYIEERRKRFPSLGEQFDMIYWDRVNGTNLWQEMIAKIKADVPKT